MSLTDFRNPEIAPGAEDTLRHVLKSGVTVINTAGFYGQGENEKVIGRAHQPHRTSSMQCEALCKRASIMPIGKLVSRPQGVAETA